MMRMYPPVISKEKESLVRRSTEIRSTIVEDGLLDDDLERPLPRVANPFFLDLEQEVENEEVRKETGEPSAGGPAGTLKRIKLFPYRGEAKKKKDDTEDFMEIFGKLEINLPFLHAMKLPTFSKFIKGIHR